jgi:thioredoxin-like negative regulator of GroEL
MDLLNEHEYFEKLIGRVALEEKDVLPPFTVIYFTAKWCGACKRLNLDEIQKSAVPLGTAWFKCDVDLNSYTAGYCNISSIPTFMVVANKQILGELTSSNTAAVCTWLAEMAGKFQKA